MLRVSGVSALLASSALAVFLFGRVQTRRMNGSFSSMGGSAPTTIHLHTDGGRANLIDRERAPAFPGDFGALANGEMLLLLYNPDETFRGIPRTAEFVLLHRWVGFLDVFEPYVCTQIGWDGRSFACDRSATGFFATLALIAAVPVLRWSLIAMSTLLLRHPR